MTSMPGWWSKARPAVWGLALVLIAASLWAAFFRAPIEAQMGIVQKIVYIHVPSAIATLVAFALTFGASIAYLATRSRTWDEIAASSCEVGMVFATIVLVSGPLWARSAWNTWWTWEPRLTTFLILWILYGGYHVVRASVSAGSRRTISAVLGIVLFVNLPIVWKSVEWWRGSLHPRAVTMTGEMRQALMLSMAAWLVFFLAVFQERLRLERLRDEAEAPR
ncbi:MAG TPA: cytochrome c biogenesis protein [Candidatus Saccharimonadales bacterium]|nr:cytochrome c biogenesis protein [Candidatus Saccharimonadales bacterium]